MIIGNGSRGGAEGGKKEIDQITGLIVDHSLTIHKNLGPGLLESVYEAVLAKKLEMAGLFVERQKRISFQYEGFQFEEGFRCDLLVEGCVIVELKSVEKMSPVHAKQVMTYLRLMNLEVGLLINFGAETLKEGLRRIVNQHQPSPHSVLRINQNPSNSATSAPPREISSSMEGT
jgi:iron complex transport system substrate-binding protein